MWEYHNWISELSKDEEKLRKKSPGRWSLNPFKDNEKNLSDRKTMMKTQLNKLRREYENLQEKKPKEPKKSRGRRKSRRKFCLHWTIGPLKPTAKLRIGF